MFNSLLNFHEAKSLGLVTRYVLYCWISGASAAPIFTAVLLCRKWQCSASCSCTHHLSPNTLPQTAVSTTRTLTCRCRPRPASLRCCASPAALRCSNRRAANRVLGQAQRVGRNGIPRVCVVLQGAVCWALVRSEARCVHSSTSASCTLMLCAHADVHVTRVHPPLPACSV